MLPSSSSFIITPSRSKNPVWSWKQGCKFLHPLFLYFMAKRISFHIPTFTLILQWDSCASNVIDIFSLDYFPILQLSWSDTWFLERIGSYFAFVTLLFTVALMICPTCAALARFWESRLLVRGNSLYIHVCQAFHQRNSIVGYIHTSSAPILNSLIYTLCNQHLKQAFPT